MVKLGVEDRRASGTEGALVDDKAPAGADGVSLFRSSGTGSPVLVAMSARDWFAELDRMARVLEAAHVAEDARVLVITRGDVAGIAAYEGSRATGRQTLSVPAPHPSLLLGFTPDVVVTATPDAVSWLAAISAERPFTLLVQTEPGADRSLLLARAEERRLALAEYYVCGDLGIAGVPCTASGIHLLETDYRTSWREEHTRDGVGAFSELTLSAARPSDRAVHEHRTGDLAIVDGRSCPLGERGTWLPNGFIGRLDDVVSVGDRPILKAEVEASVAAMHQDMHFRVVFHSDPRALDNVKVEVEVGVDSLDRLERLGETIARELGLNARIVPIRPGTLDEAADRRGGFA